MGCLSVFQAVAGEDQVQHALSVTRPLLDLVEVPSLGMRWIVGFFVVALARCKRKPAKGRKGGPGRQYVRR
jgi:hypothetical protein